MAIRYTTKHTDEHGKLYVATRTSRAHAVPEYTWAYWVKLDSGWACRGYSREESRAIYEAGRFSKRGFGLTAIVPVTAEVL